MKTEGFAGGSGVARTVSEGELVCPERCLHGAQCDRTDPDHYPHSTTSCPEFGTVNFRAGIGSTDSR